MGDATVRTSADKYTFGVDIVQLLISEPAVMPSPRAAALMARARSASAADEHWDAGTGGWGDCSGEAGCIAAAGMGAACGCGSSRLGEQATKPGASSDGSNGPRKGPTVNGAGDGATGATAVGQMSSSAAPGGEGTGQAAAVTVAGIAAESEEAADAGAGPGAAAAIAASACAGCGGPERRLSDVWMELCGLDPGEPDSTATSDITADGRFALADPAWRLCPCPANARLIFDRLAGLALELMMMPVFARPPMEVVCKQLKRWLRDMDPL